MKSMFGTGVVLVAGGLVWRANTTRAFAGPTGPAYAPWTSWETDRNDGPLGLVQAGILASNAHNAQPWWFVVSEHTISVHADHGRNVGALDPYRREMVISIGCAVENMVQAGSALGYDIRVETKAGQIGSDQIRQDHLICTLHLNAAKTQGANLADVIPMRHTNRAPYHRDRPLPEALKSEMQGQVTSDLAQLFLFSSEQDLGRISEHIVTATREIVSDREMAESSAEWYRLSQRAIDENRDGITVDSFGLSPLLNAAAKMLPPLSMEKMDEQWLVSTRDTHTATTPLYGIITVRDLYDRQAAIEAGRLWQRLHLSAVKWELGAQPLNQVPERIDRERSLGKGSPMERTFADLINVPEQRPTFMFRMGYPLRDARESPRRSVDQVVR